MKTKQGRRRSIALALLIAAVFLFALFYFLYGKESGGSSPNLLVYVIDVGQGDSFLIADGDYLMLIDGGNRGDEEKILGLLKSLGKDEIDCIVVTHPHADHIGGLKGVIDAVKVKSIYMPDVISASRTFDGLLDAISRKNLKIDIPKPQDTIVMTNASATFLGPVKEYSYMNNNSLVLKITCGKTSFLFTGDMESAAENDLLVWRTDLSADFLKVAHHGSKTSTSQKFLAEVTPRLAVISCGKDNIYRHPDADTVSRLERVGAVVYRTDEFSGMIFESDGENIKLVSGTSGSDGEKAPERTKAPDDQKPDAQNIKYIGNKRTKVFHKEGCSFLPSNQNSINFSSRKEAQDSGYRPCGACSP